MSSSLGLRGQHDDRLRAIDLADLVADREAVAARQHHVEEQQVVASAERLREAFLAVRNRVDVEAVENEHVREPGADRGFVLDDEYSRLALVHSRRAARQGSGAAR